MAAANRAELEALKTSLQQFRVNELHILLSSFKCPKLGKKTELVQRCINLLQNARNQAAVIQKIREISSSRRYNVLGPPPSAMYGQMDSGNTMNGYNPVLTIPSVLMQQSYIGAHNPFSSQMDRTRSLHIADLPFYDKLETVLDLTELPGNISGVRSTSRSTLTFLIPPNVYLYRDEHTPLPRTELQLRVFLLDHSVEQHDDFPPNCSMKIDNVPVTLPNVIPTNKPNAEPKRLSRPVNITPYCQRSRNDIRPYTLEVDWTGDKRSWAVGIYIVNRLTSKILQDRLLSNLNARRDAQETKRIIRNRLSGDDDTIQMETLRISLLCPLGKTRMSIPVKAYDCPHLQCFDLSNFLKMNEKRPTWKCAVCNNVAYYRKLVIDGYFEKVLKETSSNVTEVELLHDGGWRPVDEEAETLSDDDEEIGSSSDSKSHSQIVKINANGPNGNADDDDVIILDSDDEIPQGQPARNSTGKSQKRNVTPPVVCIDLDDSDAVDLSPQTCPASSTSSASSSSTSSTVVDVSAVPVMPGTAAAPTVGSSTQVNTARPVLHYSQQQQQQSSHPTQSLSYYSNPTISLVPPPDMMQGTSSANYYHPFEQPYPYYQQDFNARFISEELRQFMANIQNSTNASGFSRYSS